MANRASGSEGTRAGTASWKTSGRQAGWAKTAQKILQRARRQCQYTELGIRCVSVATEVDHIVPLFEGGTDEESNLQALCGRHHDNKTAKEGVRAWKQQKSEMRRRHDRTEKHPGDLS
jgi:5-methylcytosine-specific restriction protein A